VAPADRPDNPDSPKGDRLKLDRKRFSLRFRMQLPSTRDAINHAVEQVMQVACECIPCELDAPDLEISLREALANAVIHAHEGETDKQIALRCYGNPDEGVIIAIRDQGPGFDPEEIPDPREADKVFLHHGRGLFLMRELMDHVEHRKGGREVVLHKTRRSGKQSKDEGRSG
jgi:serine/threonine-protein kinase RsbW